MGVKSQVLTIIDEMIQDISDRASSAEGNEIFVLAHQMGAFQQVRVRVEREVEDDSR